MVWPLPDNYHHVGPFNTMLQFPAGGDTEEHAAYWHDIEYADIINQGKNPYLYFNEADEELLYKLRNNDSALARIMKSTFNLKRIVAPRMDYFSEFDLPANIPNMYSAGRRGPRGPKRVWHLGMTTVDHGGVISRKRKLQASDEPYRWELGRKHPATRRGRTRRRTVRYSRGKFNNQRTAKWVYGRRKRRRRRS